jgi:hypothetical protein
MPKIAGLYIHTEHAADERKRDAFWENIRLGFSEFDILGLQLH